MLWYHVDVLSKIRATWTLNLLSNNFSTHEALYQQKKSLYQPHNNVYINHLWIFDIDNIIWISWINQPHKKSTIRDKIYPGKTLQTWRMKNPEILWVWQIYFHRMVYNTQEDFSIIDITSAVEKRDPMQPCNKIVCSYI